MEIIVIELAAGLLLAAVIMLLKRQRGAAHRQVAAQLQPGRERRGLRLWRSRPI